MTDDAPDLLPFSVEPRPEVKARLMASAGAGRFEAFAPAIGELFGVDLDHAHELLGLIERSASWLAPMPGLGVLPITTEHAFLRLAPGATFPSHRHVGEERALVLCGRVRDATHDRVVTAGDGWTLAGDTHHALANDGDEDCLCAVRARGGILFG